MLFLIAAPAQAKYGGGTGGPNDPYLIFDANQMNAIGADSNDWDKHFKLIGDIDLSSFSGGDYNIIGYFVNEHIYKLFTGVFDGNGHTISNFTYSSMGIDNIGLFGYIGENAEIKDLGLVDPNINAETGIGVGSLVGRLRDGTITGCCVEGGSVSGYFFVGGLIGINRGNVTACYAQSNNVSACDYVGALVGENYYGRISNCYSAGNVTANGCVGGLVGVNVYNSFISNCYSTASVLATTDVGGLAGYNSGSVLNCYSIGSVRGISRVGGLLGSNGGSVSNCYSTGFVSGDWYVGGLVGEDKGTVSTSFWDIESSGQSNSAGGTGLPTDQMQMSSTFLAWACDPVWTIDDGNDYPRLWWENIPGELITKPSYGGGSGEPNDPYLIYTSEQLNKIALIPCDLDKHFKLMADIDLSGYIGPGPWSPPPPPPQPPPLPPPPPPSMADIDLSGYTGTSFNIIGNRDNPFAGVFDGNGHTISNFTYESTSTDNIGFFGYIDDPNAEIKDLGLLEPNVDGGTGDSVGSLVGRLREGTITNCYAEGGSVTGVDYVGGLVGSNRGIVTNCYATAIVSGDDNVGGLVGENGFSGPAGPEPPSSVYTISNCYSTGSVEGNAAVGGLMGVNDEGTITNCYATRSVTGDRYVGGLVGFNAWQSTITNCYSTGSVSGEDYVGGLVGYNAWQSTITNCYSTSSVSGNNRVGGLVGENYGFVIASFWDIETSGVTYSAGGTGRTTTQMQTKNTFTSAGWDFTTPVWMIDEGVDYPRLWWELVPVLHAEPEITPGTTNTITWDPVPGANDYYAECAEDANFTSIVYSTGWITETSCEFTGLELGQRYWYSVKARNSAGIETNWSNVESSLQATLADAVDAMLDPDTLKNKNMKNALLNKINTVQQMLDAGRYEEALNKLQNDILKKTNGCAETGRPDKNDWIITCEGQSRICPLVIETIENVKGLMNQ